jgi:HD-GYP domain-containing protein (c-di-GMP phosphodiesterase class II)
VTVLLLRADGSFPEAEGVFRGAAEIAGAEFRTASAGAPAPEAGLPRDGGRLVLVGEAGPLGAAAPLRPAAALVVLARPGTVPAGLPGLEDRITAVLRPPFEAAAAVEALRRATVHAGLLSEILDLKRRVADQGRELTELNRIGAALSAERNTDVLLSLILTKCREITSADAGSLYLVERKEGAKPDEGDYFADKVLVFELAQNDSVHVPYQKVRMDVSRKSLAGYVALTAEPLAIEDAYALPEDAEYQFNRAFDEASGYRTVSLLVIPMCNHKDEVIGVLQLINRKRDGAARLRDAESAAAQVVPFDARTADLARSLAGQAAVAIENARLYQEIQTLFEGFIRASVTAIESRDPTTSGHSERVAVLTAGLAEKVTREGTGRYAAVRFTAADIREIQYASLLHDFGKIGVKENVLLKGKKLYDHEMEAVKDRFRFLRRTLELRGARRKLRCFMELGREEALAAAAALDAEEARRLAELDGYLEAIVQANEPAVLKGESSALLRLAAAAVVEGLDGEPPAPLLLPWEAANLSIGRGSLSPEERREIESHVTHTYQFLSTIPWTRELRQVPAIAYAHHEKLDGSGYPRGVAAREIPLESKMMTISDIFDALTAKDRPYKRSIPVPRALDILSAEVKEGKLDEELFRIFVEGRVFELVAPAAAPAGS